MKKIIITIMLLFICIDVHAATRTISTSSSRISKPSTTTTTKPRVIKGISTSTKPIIKQSTITHAPTHTTTQTVTHYQYTAKQSNDNTSSLLYGIGGGVVGSIAGNMIYDALKPDQHYGNVVSDLGKTYNEILNSSGAVVGYKQQEEESSIGFMVAITIINTLLGVGLLSTLFLLFKR